MSETRLPDPPPTSAEEFCERLRRALIFGRVDDAPSSLPADCLQMLDDLAAIQRFVKGLSDGDLSSELHIKGRLAGSLKALQSNLRHLTWQVQQVAAGDLSQKVDFMGDFSAAFNTMIDRLEQSQRVERELRATSDALREAAADLNRALSQEEVLDSIITFAPGLVAADALDILMASGERMRIHRAAGRRRNTEDELAALEAIELDIARFPALEEAGRTRQAVIVAAPEGEALPGYPEAGWARGAIVMPVVIEGQTAGFICALSTAPDVFSQTDAQRLAVYNSQAAIAMSKARLVDMLAWYASTDPLTGVPNRRNFFHRAEQELDRSRRYHHPVSLMMLDIDHFKRINDRYGHTVGDQALSETAAVCVENLRSSDAIGRLGGEEFAVLLPQTDAPAALAIAERLRQAVAARSFPAGEARVHVTISIGVAEWRGGDQQFHALLSQADVALYQAKSAGRDRVVLFSPEAPT